MLKRVLSAAGAMAMLSLAASNVGAASILGSAADWLNYTTYNLSPAGTSDWVMYGGIDNTATTTDFTSGLAASSFSALTITGAPAVGGYTGGIKLAHPAGFGTYPSATASVDEWPVLANSGSLAKLSFTQTLLAPQETLNVYVLTKETPDQVWYDASASIGANSWSVVNQSVTTGPKANISIVTLNISGTTGDVLTFTLSSDYSNNISPAPASWWGVGIAGATVSAVPEPASLALLSLGGLALMRRRRIA